MFKIKQFKEDKSGAALVYVLVTAAMLILLGAATTSVAYANLKATQIQKEADNNFYSADGVMNSIVGGLAEVASKAYADAYNEILASITEYDTTAALNAQFKETYLSKLKDLLEDSNVVDESVPGVRYSVDLLKGYAELTYPDSFAYTVDAVGGGNYIDDYAEGIVLRNLHVLYEDDNGYYDEIITDIKMEVPDPGLKSLPPNEDYFNALFIVGDGLDVATNTGANVYGDVYVERHDTEKDGIEQNNALTVTDGAFFGVFPSTEAVFSGNTVVRDRGILTFENWDENQRSPDEGGAMDTKTASYFWTENIDVRRSSQLNLDGNIFVYDDLEVNGPYAKVTLAGSYYGFSSSKTSAAQSSSININGAHTEIDLLELNNMVLAGTSYIGTSKIHTDELVRPGTSRTDIQTGEAFSVKSNQIAYLVDEREWKTQTSSNDIQAFVSNPMSYVQYSSMLTANRVEGLSEEAVWENISTKIVSRPLSCFGAANYSYSSFGECRAVAVFAPYDGDKNGQKGTVYIYVQYDNPDHASRFFSTLSKTNAEAALRMRTYTEQYISKLAISPDTQFLVQSNFFNPAYELSKDANGNYIYTDSSTPDGVDINDVNGFADAQNGLGYTILGGQMGSPESLAYRNTIAQIVAQAQRRYGTPENPGASNKFEFDDLISETMVKDFITNSRTGQTEFNNEIELFDERDENGDIVGVSIKGSTEARAYIIDNKGKGAYKVSDDQGLVIATGDVILDHDFIGSINCGGTLKLTGGTMQNPIIVQYDQTVVSSVLYLYYKYGTPLRQMAVINVYKAYVDYEVNETAQEVNNDDMVKNSIHFSNWIKY